MKWDVPEVGVCEWPGGTIRIHNPQDARKRRLSLLEGMGTSHRKLAMALVSTVGLPVTGVVSRQLCA